MRLAKAFKFVGASMGGAVEIVVSVDLDCRNVRTEVPWKVGVRM